MSGFTVCSGQPLIRACPVPVRTSATATAVFLRPKHCTFSTAAVSAMAAGWRSLAPLAKMARCNKA
eukprot:CAMPEP_0115469214 /NCGR_PEP_ID=MMETSP0271-20121206/51361_1 /TAXON_ID=71861 /ORGANISM="Scrippsiella trochoidea, Strain CCMP3099" /LENGTH=65 /DNA_ID=CAMNT_0002896299 /DNA_START=23 /DNA_END=220 /DNA_ORIENTATION=-